MSTLALMRWLEAAPDRYDAGMRLITLGRVTRLHEAVARAATPGPGARVLEIGCGTGAVTARLVARHAQVEVVEQNPEMIERARARLASAPESSVHFHERTAAEVDTFEAGSFDAVVASLVLSEMGRAERAFVLREARERLRPGGILAVADEVRPRGVAARALLALVRLPQAAFAWLVAGSLSRPIPDLPGEIAEAGFEELREERWLLGSLALVEARRPR